MKITLLTLTVVIFTFGCGHFQQMQADRQRIREDLTELCASFPKPENAVDIENHEVIGQENGDITYTYDVPTSCHDAQKTYIKYWETMNWEPTKPGSTYYFKDKYVVAATCEFGSKPKRISLTCGWDSAGQMKDTLK